MTLQARHANGEVFVSMAPPIEGPWPLDLCERLAARWEARGGSWAPDAAQLKQAAQEARLWLCEHPTIDFESEDHEAL